ncbi:F-box only protein 9 [Centruroides vittatus]|uniref:F-box only protein 9 n=1 Tax=Centruroides vittatus TaxID=120091 RepID=UPI00350EFDE2
MDEIISGGESSRTGDGTGSGEDAEEAQDDDSSSTSSLTVTSMETELDQFRLQWRRELEDSPIKSNNMLLKSDVEGLEDKHVSEAIEEKARQWFLRGVQAEQNGKLYDAISFYRRAVQLVPDIEFHISFNATKSQMTLDNEDLQDSVEENENDEYSDENITDLLDHFQRINSQFKLNLICQPALIHKATHISILPTEVFIYILKWVVSLDLDLRSLEQVARVCRGFYICARDPEIWRLACLRVWGVNCGTLNTYRSWREMYIWRPRLCFNGTYISKTTYVRYGEPTFQDANYRPCYLVEYFRYLRFFPEGRVLMLTTPDDPYQSLSKLKYRKPRHPAVLSGHYRLVDNSVTAILKRFKPDITVTNGGNYRYRRQRAVPQEAEQTFHLGLEVRNVKGRPSFQLIWRHYSIHMNHRNGQETVSEFDLTANNFPPFWFSRVRSYSIASDNALQ